MKRILCFLLAVLFFLSMPATVSAQETETEPQYGLLPVLFDGVMSEAEYLNVMYQNGVVYADAYDLADCWGYEVREKEGEWVALRNKTNPDIPRGLARFSYRDTSVLRTYATKVVDTYESPAPAVSDEVGTWLPLEYTVTLLNGELLIQADESGDYYVCITPPRKCIGDVLWELGYLHRRFQFDWSSDFAYTDEMLEAMADTSNIINLINGCLSLDGTAWVALFQQSGETSEAMDAKYGDELAILMCANSQKEAQEVAKMLENAYAALSSDGLIADTIEALEDAEKGNIERNLKDYVAYLEAVIADTNTPQANSNQMITSIKKSVQNLIGYDTDGVSVLAKLEEIGYVAKTLNAAAFLIQVGAYLGTYYSQDEFSVQALTTYLSDLPKDTCMPEMMRDVMLASTAGFLENPAVYTAPRVIADSLEDVAKIGVGAVLGTPAVLASFAWDVGSSILPGLSDALDASDKFQLSLYASILQYESMVEYVDQKQVLLTVDPDAESIAKLAQYCYVYLKSCYVTRDAGVASLDGIIKKSEFESLKEQEDAINQEIAEYMVLLKTADASNEGYPLGFLPADNEVYLANHDETNLAKLILLEPYASYMEKIGELEETWGESRIVESHPYVRHDGYDLDGLCYINLVDFNADGLEELVLAYREREYNYQIHIYSYNEEEKCMQLHYNGVETFSGDVGGNRVCLAHYNGKTFLIVGTIGGYGDWYEYFGFVDEEFQTIRQVTRCDPENHYEIDGEKYSEYEFDQLEDPWFSNREQFWFACMTQSECMENVQYVQQNKALIEEKSQIKITATDESE